MILRGRNRTDARLSILDALDSLVANRCTSPFNDHAMSTAQTSTELPRLSRIERREIVRRLIKLEGNSQVLADADRRADANCLLLDALEAEDDARQN